MSPVQADHERQRGLFMLVLDDLVGPDEAGHALIGASPMRSGLAVAAAARAWIVDLLAAAARQQKNQWWPRYDEDGDPAMHGVPFRRLRNRTGLARLVLDTRVRLQLSQQTVADTCRVVQGEVHPSQPCWRPGVDRHRGAVWGDEILRPGGLLGVSGDCVKLEGP